MSRSTTIGLQHALWLFLMSLLTGCPTPSDNDDTRLRVAGATTAQAGDTILLAVVHDDEEGGFASTTGLEWKFVGPGGVACENDTNPTQCVFEEEGVYLAEITGSLASAEYSFRLTREITVQAAGEGLVPVATVTQSAPPGEVNFTRSTFADQESGINAWVWSHSPITIDFNDSIRAEELSEVMISVDNGISYDTVDLETLRFELTLDEPGFYYLRARLSAGTAISWLKFAIEVKCDPGSFVPISVDSLTVAPANHPNVYDFKVSVSGGLRPKVSLDVNGDADHNQHSYDGIGYDPAQTQRRYVAYTGLRHLKVGVLDACGFSAERTFAEELTAPAADGSIGTSPDPSIPFGVTSYLSYKLRGIDEETQADLRFGGLTSSGAATFATLTFLKTAILSPSYVNFSPTVSGNEVDFSATVEYSSERNQYSDMNYHGITGLTFDFPDTGNDCSSADVSFARTLTSIRVLGDAYHDVLAGATLLPAERCQVEGKIRKSASPVGACQPGTQTRTCTIIRELEFTLACDELERLEMGDARRVELFDGEGRISLPSQTGVITDSSCPL